MKSEIEAWKARHKLDAYLRRLHRMSAARVERVWLREIREGLEISATQFARSMKISRSALGKLEQSEKRGSIKLASLRRAAAAMNCRLIYAIVPNGGSLESAVHWRKLKEEFRARDEAREKAQREAAEKLAALPPVRVRSVAEIIAGILAEAEAEKAAKAHEAEGKRAAAPGAEAAMDGAFKKMGTEELLRIMEGETPSPDERPPGYAQLRGDPEWKG